ncbi:MAG: DUF2244 domain-containing protein [Arenicellales bacterium]|nr:DUF2244 domain-containing protein [Arenicellales bacterium]MDP6790734.1 DUF2244 domain-containing protein [Arenicellales bacterium]MDP6917924.1 DUF2244 domain-containing protein [Arenicellales bacterium]
MIRPDCSRSPSGVKAIVLLFGSVAVLIGGFMLTLGAWPVLPFLGLEAAVLAVVFFMLQRRPTFYDLVEAQGDDISLSQRSRHGERSGALNRYWAQVRLIAGQHWYPSRLLVGAHGKFMEIGTALTEEDRIRTAGQLRRLL